MLLTQNYHPDIHHQHRLAQQPQQSSYPQHQHNNHFSAEQRPSQAQSYPRRLEIDLDAELDVRGIPSSSPLSALSDFDSISALEDVSRRGDQRDTFFELSSDPSASSHLQSSGAALDDSAAAILSTVDLMHHPDAWMANGQLTPKSLSRLSHHHRESSLSSLGSAGPASPYSQNTSNPHIAVTDSVGDGYHGLPSSEEFNYQLAKAASDGFFANYPNYAPEASANPAYASVVRKNERGLLPLPEYPSAPSRSRPVSVASSLASESPAAPSLGEPDEDRRHRTGFVHVPKLDRTMTDIYNDELYSPNFTITSASPSQSSQLAMSPTSDVFAQRLQAANSQHLNAVQSPVALTSRGRSPFRQGSPLAPAPSHDFAGTMGAPQARFGSTQSLREQMKAEQSAQALRQHLAGNADASTPQTISPKDAVLEFHESDGESNFPLFPQQQQPAQQQQQRQQQQPQRHQQQALQAATAGFGSDQISRVMLPTGPTYDSMGLDGTPFNFAGSQLPSGLQVPQQYPFVARPQQQMSDLSSSTVSMMPSRVGSAESGSSGSVHSIGAQRPAGTSADGGTYTCTYHGCTLRFETPALLQKHKREGHRQAHGLGGIRKPDVPTSSGSGGMTSSLLNSQAGPHRCDRINPSTGKSCSTVFSRPYDLTRHEDTIHNARKQKVRCNLCTDEKTFSRADALTRHYRVCHPDVDLPGKHRRRTANGQ